MRLRRRSRDPGGRTVNMGGSAPVPASTIAARPWARGSDLCLSCRHKAAPPAGSSIWVKPNRRVGRSFRSTHDRRFRERKPDPDSEQPRRNPRGAGRGRRHRQTALDVSRRGTVFADQFANLDGANHRPFDSRLLTFTPKFLEQRSNHQQLRRSGAPSCGAQCRIPYGFKKTALPFF